MIFNKEKNSAADLDYTMDWSSWLPAGDVLLSSFWDVSPETSMSFHSDSVDADFKKATVWLKGGMPGEVYTVVNSIVTVGGRKESSILMVAVNRR